MKNHYLWLGKIGTGITLVMIITVILFSQRKCFLPLDAPLPQLMPWQSIGGCGAGGSGGGSSGIKWVGEGVSGGIIKLEVMPKINFGQKFLYMTAAPRLSFNPNWNTEVGISLPIQSKEAEVQYQTMLDPQSIRNGGRGDLTCDMMRTFGAQGQYSLQLALTFPTGQYDAQRGTDKTKYILPQSLQLGQGIYSATIGLFYSQDVASGLYLFDWSFNYPFMFRPDKKNQYLETDYKAYKDVTVNRERFYYKNWFKPYGESDRGDFYPSSFSCDAIYAYRGVPKLVQSFQLSFWAPFGVRWTHWYQPNVYNPIPDPDNRSWDLVLSYGMEFSRDNLPLFLGIGLPIHDRSDTKGRWDAPDWRNIGNEWLISLGLKAAMF